MSQGLFEPPWAEPFRAWSEQAFFDGDHLSLASLNAVAAREGVLNGRGLALRFVELSAEPPAPGSECDHAPVAGIPKARSHADAAALYEQRVWLHGDVVTRIMGEARWHDFYNAMVWLRFPRLKSCLNELQVASLPGSFAATETSASTQTAASTDVAQVRRGWLRDRVTLFDECGALVLTCNPSISQELAAFEWDSLFVRRRQSFASQLRVVLVGHALHEKLRRPYKSLCAQCIVLDISPDSDWPVVDAAARTAVLAGRALHQPFMPLPLLGIPGWCPANQDPAFYNDPRVFRPGRRVR